MLVGVVFISVRIALFWVTEFNLPFDRVLSGVEKKDIALKNTHIWDIKVG